jgi:hypothetical protein
MVSVEQEVVFDRDGHKDWLALFVETYLELLECSGSLCHWAY